MPRVAAYAIVLFFTIYDAPLLLIAAAHAAAFTICHFD